MFYIYELKYFDLFYIGSFIASLLYTFFEKEEPRVTPLALGLGTGLGAWSGIKIAQFISLCLKY